MTWSARADGSSPWDGDVSAAVGEFASEVEVLAVGLFKRVPQRLYFFSVLLLQAGDLAGQGEDEGALLVVWRRGGGNRPGLGPESFDASAQVGVVIEERVGDVGLALDGLEGDWLTAFDQGADRLLRRSGLGLGFGLRGGGEGLGAFCAGIVGHGRVLR
ncbi:hypothetical protein AQJ58_24400 [Streptomyces sp. DSM 15324]|nr:hypothetical protein AQJ58_24400 [Streptomyces sp. DSM 15324]